MKIETSKDLALLVKQCRKLGIRSLELNGVKIELGDTPKRKEKFTSEQPKIEGQVSDEDLLFWSAGDNA